MSEWRTSSRESQIGETARFAAVSPRRSASLLPELRTSLVQPLAVASGSDDVPSDAAIRVRCVFLVFASFYAMLNERPMPGGSSDATKCAGCAGLLSTLGFLGKCRQETQHIVHTEILSDGSSKAVKLCWCHSQLPYAGRV
jgi:hypothetical protein